MHAEINSTLKLLQSISLSELFCKTVRLKYLFSLSYKYGSENNCINEGAFIIYKNCLRNLHILRRYDEILFFHV